MDESETGELPGILDGSADEVSPAASRIIRVFLSSTFSDMAEERNMLLQDVYPKIAEYAKRKYGVNFQMVDMRWGVTNEAQNDHMTSACCLKEIENCQNVSVGPNFVMLMGQKYGYRPIPASIDADEFEIIRKHLEDEEDDLSVLDIWYLRDENIVPPQYVLQPIDSILKNYDSSDDDLKKASRDEWQDTFEELREILMSGAERAFDNGEMGGQTKEKYFNSVTQEEIELGLLQSSKELNKKCLCFVRDIEDLLQNVHHHRAMKFIDLLPVENGSTAEIDIEAQDRLKLLRDNDIPQKLHKDNIVRLSTHWSDSAGISSSDNSEYLDKLGQSFYDKMTWLIDSNLEEKNLNEDEQTKEIRQSLLIRNKWSSIFFGRTGVLKTLEKYIKDGSNNRPFAVYGESGTGKTAVIAKCAKEARKWVTSAKPVIIMRFLGTSPRSSHILLTLQSLCTQVCDAYGMDKSNIPSEFKELVIFFSDVLKKVTSQSRPLFIFLDSVDQLSVSFDPFTFQWLPKYLPKNVKVVLSFVPSVFNLLKRFKVHLGDKTSNAEPLPALGDVHSMDIIKARLSECDRTITQNQSAIIQEIFSKCSLPLFSRVMLEEILTWKSYTAVSLDMVSSSLKEALNNFFRRLELHHGKVLVRHALAYITAARDGLSEMELLDLLSLDDEVLNSIFLFWLPPIRRIPTFLWTRLRLELGVFLVERDAGNVEVFSWYHRMFKEAATERYLVDEETKIKIHKNIAEYFLGTWSGKEKPFRYSVFLKSRLALTTDDGAEDRNVPAHALVLCRSKKGIMYNKRKLTELPFHLIKCGNKQDLFDKCLFNYNWLWTKITASGLQFVVEDFELALTVFEDIEVQTLADTLRIAGVTLDEYPENLALEITGRLIDLFNTMPKIRDLLHKCDEQGIMHSSVVVPVQMYEVPISSLTRSIEGATADNGDNLLVRKDTRVVSICLDGNVQSWDTSKGTLVSEVSLPKMKSHSYHQYGLYPSRDERYIVCECRTGSQYIYTLETDSLRIVNEHKLTKINAFHDITVSRNYVCMDSAVYEIHHGKKVRDLNHYRKVNNYVQLAITQCEKYILIGDETLEMYKIYTGKRVKQLPVTNCVSCIEMTSDGRLAIIGSTIDCAIKIFDVNDLSPTFGEEVVTYNPQSSFPEEIMSADSYASQEVSEFCLSNKEGAFVSLVKRKYPIIWSLKNVSTKPRLLRISKGPNPFRYLFQVQFTADDKFILAAELSPNIMMWDSVTGNLVAAFQAHGNDIHDLVVGRHSPVAITAQQNGHVINVWDLQKVLTMEKMSSVKQQEYSVKNIAFSNQSNIIFLTRVQPPKSSKAYHFIDHFGIEIIDLASGKAGTLLPFDRYGHVLSIANSKDASVVVICTGNAQSNSISVINVETGKLLKTMSVPGCKSVKLSSRGDYMCILTDEKAELYSVPAFKVLGKFNDCASGMFTKTNAFVGIGASQLLIQESMEDDETLTIDLAGDVIAIHYCDVIDLILITVDDGLQVVVTAFKTEGFGAIGSLTDVSRDGINDIADDGSVCIDSELQVFELERCKRIKKLLPNSSKGDVTSVRLSSKGEHAVYIDTIPAPCVKVCRVSDSQIVAKSFLHCVPEFLEVIPTMNLIVVIGKDNKKLFVLALRDQDRKYKYTNMEDRVAQILGVKSFRDISKFELPEKLREALKENTKSDQIKHITLNENERNVIGRQDTVVFRKKNIKKSRSCKLL